MDDNTAHCNVDRTAEFNSIIKSRKEKPQYAEQYRNEPVNNLPVDPFIKMAQECAYKIGDSFEKLKQLTVLAKKRTLFDDGELNRLIDEIRVGIRESKERVDYLQNMRGGNIIVKTLQQKLANVTSNFQSTLQIRSHTVQQQAARQDMFGGPIPAERSLEPQPMSSHMSNGYQQHYDQEESTLKARTFPHQQQQQQQQMILMNDTTDMSGRDMSVMHNIESTIVELGTVFNQLATMVQAQGETITRIDMNISETAGHVEGAHEALLNYFASINSNRWLILKVFAVLFAFFVVSVIFSG